MNFVLIIFCLVVFVICLYLYDKYLFQPLPHSLEVESYYNLAARRFGEEE